MSYKLTNEAVNDLYEIWMYTFEIWSEKQADNYLLGLEKTFTEIATNPKIGVTKYQLHKKIRVYHYKKHYIFYILDKNNITIVAVFHEKMNAIKRISTRLL